MPEKQKTQSPSLFTLLKPYKTMIIVLVVLAIVSNGLSLIIPRLLSHAIDAFTAGTLHMNTISVELLVISFFIFVFTYLQSITQTYASERVAKDLRTQLITKLSQQSYAATMEMTPAKLLTNITSDVDAVKTFVSQAVVSLVSSIVLIVGASILLININWRLALMVLLIIPGIGVTFFMVLKKVRPLFQKTQEVIDYLNKVINESIIGSALVRVVHAAKDEHEKFFAVNTKARDIGLSILNLFAALIPAITFIASMATLIIVLVGGRYVIGGSMSLGDFTAFNSYIGILIFPIIVVGFVSNIIARSATSYARIHEVLSAPDPAETGDLKTPITGAITFSHVTMTYGEKNALDDITVSIAAGSKTAIIGPTAAGKTQLLYLLTALISPTRGMVLYDGHQIAEYDQNFLHTQIGFVFQDSVLFNTSVRENIAFSSTVTESALRKAIETAELTDFIGTLEHGLDTIVSERGTSLSGGQKQRIMLARALALNPTVLLLDDFTARVDTLTEKKILTNIQKNYPHCTLVSVTQKISAIEHYDKIILIMEGEVLAEGTHEQLLATSPEYVQIYNSQRSTNHYE